MWAKYKKQHGFTIVELLIVIVVIGILAAITIVAYSGVQERAESTKTIAQAEAYVKGLKLWEVDAGVPTTSSCIAPSSVGVTCAFAQRWNVNVPVDGTFNAKLATYSGITSPQLGKYGDDNPKGLMWYHANYYGDNRSVLRYAVGPNSDCGLSGVLSVPYDELILSGAKYTSRSTIYTECIVEISKW